MQLRQRHTTETHRTGAPRLREPRLRDVSTTAPQLEDESRLRDSGGPDDRAFYRCGCGGTFRADVSTSVSCPHCGGEQAW